MGAGADGFGFEDSFQRLYSKELDLDEGKNISPNTVMIHR